MRVLFVSGQSATARVPLRFHESVPDGGDLMDAADRTLEKIKGQLKARGIKEFAFVSKDPGSGFNVVHLEIPARRNRKIVRAGT